VVWPMKPWSLGAALGVAMLVQGGGAWAQRICVGVEGVRGGQIDEDEWIELSGSLTQPNMAVQCVRMTLRLDVWSGLGDPLRRGPQERMYFDAWRDAIRRYRQRGVTTVLLHLPPETTGESWLTLATPEGRGRYLAGLARVLTEFRGLVTMVELPEQPNARAAAGGARMRPADYIDLVAGAELVRGRVPLEGPSRCASPWVAAGALLLYSGKVAAAQPGYLYLREALEEGGNNPSWSMLRRFGGRGVDHLAVQGYLRVSTTTPGADLSGSGLSGVDEIVRELDRYYGMPESSRPRVWITGAGSSSNDTLQQNRWQGDYVRNTLYRVFDAADRAPVEAVTFTEMLDDGDPVEHWGLRRGRRWDNSDERPGIQYLRNEWATRRPILSARALFTDLQGVTLGTGQTRRLPLRIWNMGPSLSTTPSWSASRGLRVGQAEGCPSSAGIINGLRWVGANPPGVFPGIVVGGSLPFAPSPPLVVTAARNVDVEVEAPDTPGDYLVAAQMYDPDAGFFGNAATIAVRVVPDAGPTDTGPTDTGPTDTGPTDTGPAEAGLDAGADAGADAGTSDVGGFVDLGIDVQAGAADAVVEAEVSVDAAMGFDVGARTDAGADVVALEDVPVDAERATDAGVDAETADDVAVAVDAGVADAGRTVPSPAGCGCRSTAPSGSPTTLLGALLIFLGKVCRRRRQSPVWDTRRRRAMRDTSRSTGR
jgi:MYXO-CTERM domain-containing protein